MHTFHLLFYCAIPSLCFATDQKQIFKEAPIFLEISPGLRLMEVTDDINEVIIKERNEEIQKIAQEISGIKDLFAEYGNYLGEQEALLNDLDHNLEGALKDTEEAIESLEDFIEEEPTPSSLLQENKPELVLSPEAQEHLDIPANLPPEKDLLKENGWAAGIGTASGLTALGIAYVAAAPVTVTATVTAGAVVLGAGGTKLHFNKESLPTLPTWSSLPSLPRPTLPSLPKISLPSWVPLIGSKDNPLPKTDK